jgi:glycosyltransferase involved in cell wall biosynthesis
MKAFAWLHVCHSAASKERPANVPAVRITLPPKHRLLCLNEADVEHLAAHYATSKDNVVTAPNARDITTFGRFDPHAELIVDRYGLAEADVVQVFPVSGTRMGAKGVPVLISIFGHLAKLGLKVKLVLVNAHSNSDAVRNVIGAYRKDARSAGLASDDLIVTSEDFPGSSADGLSIQAVHDLFQVSNLFVLPSISEASSLTLLEAAMSGCLIVTNGSLHTVRSSLNPTACISARFGSVREPGDTSDHAQLAEQIAQALSMSLMNQAKRDVLRRYSYRAVGERLVAAVVSTPAV